MTRAAWSLGLLLAWGSTPALGQSESGVEILARVLRAEDTRHFDENTFRQAVAQPDSSLRSAGALGLGRLRDPGGVPLLVPLLLDPDTTVQVTAAFALGLIGDRAAVPALIGRTRDPSPLSSAAAFELIAALNRLGGPEAAGFLGGVMTGGLLTDRPDRPYLAGRAALDAWRLGNDAPVQALVGLMQDPSEETRFAAAYSLGRLRSTAAAPRMLEALHDRSSAPVRATAARTLTRTYADSAGLDPGAVADVLAAATTDDDAGVRISALRALGTYHLPALAPRLVPLLEDAVPNVQVQAAAALGDLGPAPGSASALLRALEGKGSWARRREALLSLARVDTAAFGLQATRWMASADWRDRASAAAGLALVSPEAAAAALTDHDPRVVAAALEAWGDAAPAPSLQFLAACRRLGRHADAAVRAVALQGLARSPEPADLPLLLGAYAQSTGDSFPDAALSALAGIVALGRTDPRGAAAVDREALGALSAPSSYVIRRWAEQNWPAATELWGPAFPLDAHRTLEDYRGLARTYLVGQLPDRYPKVRVEIEQLGTIELELFGPEAPLTVAHFLRLVDRHYFDGIRFHRVVPNFVVQGGDPRGDGWGGPGEAIRDEINPRRYKSYTLGMALSGPDTGGSQWFITLSPQPHLDGSYTVFGQVTDGIPVLLRLTQGDRIRTIRR